MEYKLVEKPSVETASVYFNVKGFCRWCNQENVEILEVEDDCQSICFDCLQKLSDLATTLGK